MGAVFLTNLAALLRSYMCARGDYIIHAGEIGHEMYTVIRGTVVVLVGEDKKPVR